jgi:hypothetical protein
MAQGIIIALLDQPIEGDYVRFTVYISGIPIAYNNGQSSVYMEFTANDAEVSADPLHKIKIGADADATALNVLAFLNNTGYFSTSIPIYNETYKLSINYIKSTYTSNSLISFDIESSESQVSITAFNDNVVPTIGPKYFLQYKNAEGIEYKTEIYAKGHSGAATEINGRAVISKAEAKDHLDIFRGTGLTLQLEASETNKFEDLMQSNYGDVSAKFYINNALQFVGFLTIDGGFESFVTQEWNLNLEFTDRLGDLDSAAFVQDSGLTFNGKMKLIDIIRNALNRTGLQLRINTYIDVFYYGSFSDIESDMLAQTYVSVDRYIKEDDNTIMGAKEVLTSILSVFNAVITQRLGEWWIYRPNDFSADNLYPNFKQYEISGNYIGLNTLYLGKTLGSDCDGFYPHHCDANQQSSFRAPLNSFRVAYKYGFLGSLLKNPNLTHDVGTTNYDYWDFNPYGNWVQNKNSGYVVIDPVSEAGIKFKAAVTDPGETYQPRVALRSNYFIELQAGNSVEFRSRVKSYGFPAAFRYRVRVGTLYLNYLDGSWTTTDYTFTLFNAATEDFPNGTGEETANNYERSFSVKSQPLPDDFAGGELQIEVWVPFKGPGGQFSPVCEIKSVEAINTFAGNNVEGEFHTVSRINKISAKVGESETVSNGDSTSTLYEGAFYQSDQETLTDKWYRLSQGGHEAKPILRISAEDNLRLYQRNLRVFSGTVYGYIDFISLISINNLSGKFMPISWSFDTYANKLTLKAMELENAELYDIKYEKTLDYGATVKPTIIG